MWSILWLTLLVPAFPICRAHERFKKAIENDSINQKAFDGYNYPAPNKPFSFPSVSPSTRAPPIRTTSLPKSSIKPLSSSQPVSFSQKTPTAITLPQTRFPSITEKIPQRSTNGYVYSIPAQPFTVSSIAPTKKPSFPTSRPISLTTRPSYGLFTSSPISSLPSTNKPYFPATTPTYKPFVPFTQTQTNRPSGPGYVYTTPKTPLTFSQAAPSYTKPSGVKTPNSNLPSTQIIPSYPQQPQQQSTRPPYVSTEKPSKPNTIPFVPFTQTQTKGPSGPGYVYTTPKTPLTFSQAAPSYTKPSGVKTPNLNLPSTQIIPSYPKQPQQQSTRPPYVSTKKPLKPNNIPSASKPFSKPVSLTPLLTRPPYISTSFNSPSTTPASPLSTNLPTSKSPFPSQTSTKLPYFPPLPSKIPTNLPPSYYPSVTSPKYPRPPTSTSPIFSTPITRPSYGPPPSKNKPKFPQSSSSTRTPGYLPPKPTQGSIVSVPSIQTQRTTPRPLSQFENRPPKPTQGSIVSIPSIQTQRTTSRPLSQFEKRPSQPTQIPSQPSSRPPPYLPPSTARPNYVTVTAPPYPTPLYSITPSTSSLPPPTGYPAPPPTIPPSTYRPVGYNYAIPDLPFEFRKR